MSRPGLLALLIATFAMFGASVASADAAPTPFVIHVPVLMYHRILCADETTRMSGLFVCPELLDQQMAALASRGWHTITADQLATDIEDGVCPSAKTFVITVDDGALDGYANGAPIWEKYGFRATFAMVVGKAGDYHSVPDLTKPHFDWDQARDLVARGFGIANHTMNHTSVAALDQTGLDAAVQAAQDRIDQELNFYPKVFVYPYGSVGSGSARDYLATRFTIAFTTAKGASESTLDPMRSPRIRVAGTESPARVVGDLQPYADPCSNPTPTPSILLSPSSKDFGYIPAGGASDAAEFTVTNVGTANLNISDVNLAGESGQFEITADSCSSRAVPPRRSCTLEVAFRPTNDGLHEASLVVDSGDAETLSAAIMLTGFGGPAPNGSISIALVSHPHSAQTFRFSGTDGLGQFVLADDGTGSNVMSASLPEGSYSVSIDKPDGWSLSALSCAAPETISRRLRTATIQLASGERVSCTFTESMRVADSSIAARRDGPFVGEGVYSTTVTPDQTISRTVAPGSRATIFVRLQNDGPDPDSFRLSGTASSTAFNLACYTGGHDVTAKVRAGTYSFALAQGAARVVKVVIRAPSGMAPGTIVDVTVTVKSKSAPSVMDTVAGHVTST